MTESDVCATTHNKATTIQFAMGRGEFARIMISRFGGKWWILLSILILGGMAAGAMLSDWRWGVAALMLTLVIAPMIAAFLYFSYGLRKECYVNVIPHRVCLDSDGITVSVDVMPRPDETSDDDTDPEPLRSYETHFPGSAVRRYSIDPKGVTVDIANPSRGFIRLPYSAFESAEHFRVAVEILVGLIRNRANTQK